MKLYKLTKPIHLKEGGGATKNRGFLKREFLIINFAETQQVDKLLRKMDLGKVSLPKEIVFTEFSNSDALYGLTLITLL